MYLAKDESKKTSKVEKYQGCLKTAEVKLQKLDQM